MDSYQEQSMSWDEFLAAWTSRNPTDDKAAIMPIQLTNSAGTNGTSIENLNEDCLLEIFSCNSLTLMDLCSLAETCTRFKQITQRVFATGYCIHCIYAECEFTSKNYYILDMRQRDVQRILKNFGQHLSTLSIDEYCQDVVNWVGQYCEDVTLKRLKISGMHRLDIKPLDLIFQRVQKLTIDVCTFNTTVSWFARNCSSLIELEIDFSRNCAEIMECTFPNLERFTLQFSDTHSKRRDILYEFFSRHNHLKFIWIPDVGRSRLLHAINSNCNELHELCLNYSAGHSFSSSIVGSLTKLKILDLRLKNESPSQQRKCIPLLKAVKSLEVMTIRSLHNDGISPQIYDVLSKLTHLRELHLTSRLANDIPWTMLAQLRKVDLMTLDSLDLPNIIEQLDNLEELVYRRSSYLYLLSEEIFLKICKIVERREHVLTLKCMFKPELKKYCDDNRRVKLRNLR